MDGGSGYNQWTPENYVVEVVDCLLRQRGYDGKDDVIDAIGTNFCLEFGNVSVSLLENESSEGRLFIVEKLGKIYPLPELE